MKKTLAIKQNGKTIYPICMEQGAEKLSETFSAVMGDFTGRKVCIVTDSNVGPLHGESVRDALLRCAGSVEIFTFPAGEASKTLDTVRELYTFLIEHHFDRKDCLAALGGGVVGDLTGYAAATYLRGIDFIQIPTSLLAMVDSSVGGKTGVDFDAYKNMVGAFYMPRLVYMNIDFLDTLPEEHFFNGMAEVVKYGLIQDLDFYEYLLAKMAEILAHDPEVVEEIVYRSCLCKKEVVEEDPTEKGRRAILNFGHTLGHAIEKTMDLTLLHGQCVALGMVCAAWISWQKGHIEKEDFYEIRDVLVAFRLPITVEGADIEQILAASKLDKKMDKGTVRFILLRQVGDAMISTDVTEEEMRNALLEILYVEDEVAD